MINLYKLWYNTNSVLGSIIHIELPIFLITLNGTFKQKFDSILNNVIFKELKKYQYTSKIGGVGCLDLLYNGPVEDIKYFIIFDKQWDKIAIDIYSTLIIGDTSSQSGKNIDQIIYDLVFEGYFLEEKKEEYTNFYKKLFSNDCVYFSFYISKLHQKKYHNTECWRPLSDFYAQYVNNVYHVNQEVTKKYQIFVENNKFFLRWAIVHNSMLHHMSLYKDESLKEVCDIYRSLGITSRINMNASLLNGYEPTAIVFDWMSPGERLDCCEPVLVRSILNRDHIYKRHTVDVISKIESEIENVLSFESIVYENNYGDVTAPIHPDRNKERSISCLSSIRLATELYPRALNYCVRPNAGVSVVNMDLYDELQLKLPEYCKIETRS